MINSAGELVNQISDKDRIAKLESQLSQALMDNKELKEVMKFYRDKHNYKPENGSIEYHRIIENDDQWHHFEFFQSFKTGGKRACDILEKLKEELK